MGTNTENQGAPVHTPRTVTADADGVRVAGSGTGRATTTSVGGQELTERSKGKVEEVIEHTVEGADDFEKLLAETDAGPASSAEGWEPGKKVVGIVEVISLHGQEVFLDLGGKANGYILKEELRDDEGNLTVKQGDRVEGVVEGTDFNGIRICRMVSQQSADIGRIRDAQASGLPVEGTVTGTNKGGFDIRLGRVKAFCPHSQIDLYRPADPEALVGQVFRFKVTEIKSGGAVVSRAALLREERSQNADAVRATIKVGARLQGTVRSIQKFGVFVDLGGVDGLVHMSELSWSRTEDAHELVELGQTVEVEVTEIDTKRDRIGLSIKRATADPFVQTFEGISKGQVLQGVVARLTTFGAFVTIAPGVDGMVHVSDMSHKRIGHPREILNVGDNVEVKVKEIDLERRRVGLSLKAMSEDPWAQAATTYSVGQTVSGKVVSIQDFGVFVEVESGITALLPASESGLPRNKGLSTVYRVGSEVSLQVLRVDIASQKMALSTREAADLEISSGRPRSGGGGRSEGRRGGAPRSADARVWMDREVSEPKKEEENVGSLGAALMAALAKNDKD
jgi:small subunit ribosomal protein S1